MAQSYKTLKEDFVSNLSGGQISEINYVTAVAPVGHVAASIAGPKSTDTRIGGGSTLVCSSITSGLLRQLWPYCVRDRLSSQCWSNPTCNDLVLFCSLAPQSSVTFPSLCDVSAPRH